MCKCNPQLRTMWCGQGDCVPPKEKPQFEPVKASIDMTQLMSMRQTCRNAINPSIKYKTGMEHHEVIQQAEAARVNALNTIHSWLDELIGDGM